MDKNTVIGIILIIAVFIGFSWFNKPSKQQVEEKRYQDSIAYVQQVQEKIDQTIADSAKLKQDTSLTPESDSLKSAELQNAYGTFSAAAQGEEKFITLENELLEVKLSTKGGRVYSARLKNYATHDSLPLMLFDKDEALFGLTLITPNNRIINTSDLFFESQQGDSGKVIMKLNAGENSSLNFVYRLSPNDYMLRFEIESNNLENQLAAGTNSLDLLWNQKLRAQEMGRKYEGRYAYLMYKYLADDVEHLKEGKDDAKDIANKLKWIGYKDQFFSSALIADEDFEASKLESKYHDEKSIYLKEYKMTSSIGFDPKGTQKKGFYFFFGPNDYSLLKDYDKTHFKGQDLELEKLVPLGWGFLRYVNKWIMIPIFDFWTNLVGSIGLAIFLLTLTIKTLLFPLTYKSFMSSAKMRVMRPQVEAINDKMPGQENAMARQQKTMELYRQAGVNPLSGCLPMVLQMPFLFALFMFFPSAIELRQASFLWAKDLSTYDAIITWNANIPFISSFLGNHISLFCLLMTITSIVYSKFSMEQTNTGQQQMPGMKVMMYVMPVMMFFFLNSFPAGLNYYYFISTLITVLQTVTFRFFVNEDKLLAKLEENKKKPAKKKSGFMARLEEAQKQQQQALAKQKAQQQKKGK